MGLKHPSSVYQYEAELLPFTYSHLLELQRITGISIWRLAWPDQRKVMREIVRSPRPAMVAGAA